MNDLIWKQIEEDKYQSIGGLIGDRKFVGSNHIVSEEEWNNYKEQYMDYYRKLIG